MIRRGRTVIALALLSVVLGGCLRPEDPPSAQIEVFLCADFLSCSDDTFLVNGTCVGHTDKADAYNTISYNLAPSTSYAVSACVAGCASCGGVANFTTPAEFPDEVFRSGFNFYCSTPCNPP